MKDNRFIELLNLYIDRQITVAETTELEAEIQQNPKRQAVYRQYCQIHSATKLVYDSFRVGAGDQTTLLPEQTGVVELFETKRRRIPSLVYAAAGLAAAACLALVVLRQNAGPHAGAPVVAAKGEIAPSVSRPVAVEVAGVSSAHATEPVSGVLSLRNSVTSTPDFTAVLAALREQDEERALANGHPQTSRNQSLFDDGLFNPGHLKPLQDPRMFRIQQTSVPQPVESTVFQFQR